MPHLNWRVNVCHSTELYQMDLPHRAMHYVSFSGMLSANLFEALCVGHAPKKRPIYGK